MLNQKPNRYRYPTETINYAISDTMDDSLVMKVLNDTLDL